ncbi:UNVERIFIED_CONTAM: hypothetical protein GTU68_004293 [Idotea baltica]|nr:hypothetical protein [Idotea baltica]
MAIKLQAVLAAWKSFDLNTTQHELDETASEITLKQDESDVSRKKLVELLKECKKNFPEESRKLSPMIKSFQNEVDFLSKRSKFAETSFLKNYQKFLDIIDPVPGLEYAIGLERKVCLQEELELENKRMKLTIKEYNEELKEVKNQDITIKSLKDKIKKFEDQMEVTMSNRMKELEKEYTAMYAEKENLLLETHDHGIQKVREVEERCQALQQSLEQSQSELFEVKAKLDDITEAKSSEIDILMNDLERANHQASVAQKQLSELQKSSETESTVGGGNKKDFNPDIHSIELSSLEAEVAGKDKEISQLIGDIKSLQTALANLKETSSTQILALQDEMHHAKMTITNYEARFSQQKDYEEVKRELAIIKSIEFACIDDLNSKSLPNSASSKPLELLLLEKNKTLQNENTTLKLRNEDIASKYDTLEKECSNLKSLTSEQSTLITQLESDLLSIQSMAQIPREATSQMDLLSEAVKSALPNVQSNNSPNLTYSHPSPQIFEEPPPSTASESLVSIISAQRERFKSRNEELEAELLAKGSQVTLIQNELDSLRADNIKLYEKIRFLQSYAGNTQPASDSFPESRYSNQYEHSLDPFRKFSQGEKQKRYSSLSPFEKITLSLGQLILKSKRARTVSFIYVSVLHCLVFLVLYKFAFDESNKRDFYSDCAKKFAEHMSDVHGQNT